MLQRISLQADSVVSLHYIQTFLSQDVQSEHTSHSLRCMENLQRCELPLTDLCTLQISLASFPLLLTRVLYWYEDTMRRHRGFRLAVKTHILTVRQYRLVQLSLVELRSSIQYLSQYYSERAL